MDKYPYDMDFQTRAAAMLLQDPVFLRSYRDVVSPRYFESPVTAVIVRVVLEYYDRFAAAPDRVAAHALLRDYARKARYDDVAELCETVDLLFDLVIRGGEYVQDRIAKFGRQVAVREGVAECVSVLERGEDPEQCRSIMEAALLSGSDALDVGTDFFASLDSLPEEVQRENASRVRIPTGLPLLDEYTGGGPCCRETWMAVGGSGAGKSVFLTNLGATALKSGINVVHYTIGDLEDLDVRLRYAARCTGVPLYDVSNGSSVYRAAAADLMSQMTTWGSLLVRYYPSGRPSLDTLRSHLMRVKMQRQVSGGLVIIDYLDEIKMQEDDAYIEGGRLMTGLRQIASDFNVLIWTASQVSRVGYTAKKKKDDDELDVLRKENVADSARKFWKADGVITYNQRLTEYDAGRARLWVDKVRRGRKWFIVPLVVDFPRMYMGEDLTV